MENSALLHFPVNKNHRCQHGRFQKLAIMGTGTLLRYLREYGEIGQ